MATRSPVSSTVSAWDQATAAQYNNLRTDALAASARDTVIFTRAMTAWAWDVIINHDLWYVPTMIEFHWNNGTIHQMNGAYVSGKNNCIWMLNSTNSNNHTDRCIQLWLTTNWQSATVTAVSSTTFTLTWATNYSSGASTANLIAILS